MQIFFRKTYILPQMQICSQKKAIENFLRQIFIFVYEENAYHTIFIYENFMISIFLTEIEFMFLIVNMPSIIDILI